MPKKDHTEIICILDRSGSMSSIEKDAVGGFNTFLEEQKKLPGTASVTLVLFDNAYLTPVKNADINTVQPLNKKTYVPRGSTALLDAVGRTVSETGARLAAADESERPENVIICILTDGEENSSREFSLDQVKEMISHQKDKYNWEFIFLAANQDAFAGAGRLGIDRDKAFNFTADEQGTKGAFVQMNCCTTQTRSKKSKDGKDKA